MDRTSKTRIIGERLTMYHGDTQPPTTDGIFKKKQL